MGLKSDLQGYILAMAARADEPLVLSAPDIHQAFAQDYPKSDAFEDAFIAAMSWLRDEGLIRVEAPYAGTQNECVYSDIVATSAGESAVSKASSKTQSPRSDVHVEVSRMLGAFVGEIIASQK